LLNILQNFVQTKISLPRSGYFPLNFGSHYLYFIEIVEEAKAITVLLSEPKESGFVNDKEITINVTIQKILLVP